ncbi:Beta-1 [Mactra antiquata]
MRVRLFRLRTLRYITYVVLVMSVYLFWTLLWIEDTSESSNNLKVLNVPVVPKSRKVQDMTNRKSDPDINPALKTFNCRKLFDGDRVEKTRAKKYLAENRNFTQRTNLEMRTLTENCDRYKEIRGYHTKPMSSIEEGFPLAFNILFYKNVEQLERLLRTIYRPQNQYCIHIDKKTPESVIEIVQLLTDCFDNVFIASRLEIVVYASYTRLKADINCMEDHIENGYNWKYLINMAASEFPVMSNHQIVEILKSFNGANDIHEVFSTMDKNRFKKRYYTYIDLRENDGYMIHSNDLKEDPPHGLTITKGNAYNVFSIDFVKFALSNQKARDLLSWSADTYTPDEHYWATLNNLYSNPFLHTPGGCKAHPDKKPFFGRYIGWKDSNRCHSGHFVHNICIFGMNDLQTIKLRHEIIANKFDIEYDPIAYMCMEEWIRNKTINSEDLPNQNVYKKLDTFQN